MKVVVPILVVVFTMHFYSKLYSQSWEEIQKVVASDRSTEDRFGSDVAVSGNYAIVGSPQDDHNSFIQNAGSAYVYEKNLTGQWVEVQKLIPSDIDSLDLFGSSVAISGNYAVVGAYQEDHDTSGASHILDAGSVYVFERSSSGTWIETQKLVASDRNMMDRFGTSVSIHHDYLFVGAPNEDHNINGGSFLANAGSVYVFERTFSGLWVEVQKLVASDRMVGALFGNDVSVHGDIAVIGSQSNNTYGNNTVFYNAGSAYIFERNPFGVWQEKQKLVASDQYKYDFFGNSVSISDQYAIIGAFNKVCDTTGGNWTTSEGAAYIFEQNAFGVWQEKQKLIASDKEVGDYFGISVSISAGIAVVGAHHEDEDTSNTNMLVSAGSAYIFERSTTGIWEEKQKLVASDRMSADEFAVSVSISDSTCVIGANQEDHDVWGNNTKSNAGAAYVFGIKKPCDISIDPDSIEVHQELNNPVYDIYWNPTPNSDSCQIQIKGYNYLQGVYTILPGTTFTPPFNLPISAFNSKILKIGVRCFCDGNSTPWKLEMFNLRYIMSQKTEISNSVFEDDIYQIYHNGSHLIIQSSETISEVTEIMIYDVLGRSVVNDQMDGFQSRHIDTKEKNMHGQYFISIFDGNGVSQHKTIWIP